MQRLLSCFIFSLFFSLNCASQSQVDSLKLALKNVKHDTTKCIILNQLVEKTSDEEWPAYNEALLKLAEEKSNTTATENKNFYLRYLANALTNAAYLAKLQGDMPRVLDYFKKSLKIQEKIQEKNGMATSLNNIGFTYRIQGDIPKSLEYYHRSLKIREEINDKRGIAISLNNFGSIYESQGDVTRALEYFNRSLKIQKEIGDKEGMAHSLTNIGAVLENHTSLTDSITTSREAILERTLKYYQRSLKLFEEIGEKDGIAICLTNIGGIYSKQGSLPKALEYHLKGLKIREETKNKDEITYSLNSIGGIFLKQGALPDALNYASRSLALSRELGFPENINTAALLLKKIYQKQNNYKSAFEMYQLEIQMRDSINNIKNKKAVLKKQFQYDYEKKEAVANAEHKSEMEKQQAVANEKNRKQKILIWSVIGGLLLVTVFSGFIFRALRVTRKQKEIIEVQKAEVEAAKILVEEQKHAVEEQQKEIIDSITYARRIQRALITNEKYIEKELNRLAEK